MRVDTKAGLRPLGPLENALLCIICGDGCYKIGGESWPVGTASTRDLEKIAREVLGREVSQMEIVGSLQALNRSGLLRWLIDPAQTYYPGCYETELGREQKVPQSILDAVGALRVVGEESSNANQSSD